MSTPLLPPGVLAKTVEPGSPSTRPLARGSRASLNLGVVRRLLQPNSTRGHTLRAVDPRARVRLSPRYPPAPMGAGCVGRLGALPHREPASRNLHAPALAVAFHLRGRSRSRAGALERRSTRALDELESPSSWRPGHPGHRFDSPPGLDDLAAPRTGRDSSWTQPRERLHLRENQGAFRRDRAPT